MALIEADRLGQLRTGATTGVAVEAMADPQATEMGLFGAGWQAQSQLAAVARVRPIKVAYVYSRNEKKRNDFAELMSAQTGNRRAPGRSTAGGRRGPADRGHRHHQPRAGFRRQLAGRRNAGVRRRIELAQPRPRSTAPSFAAPTTSSATASRPARSRPAISSTRSRKGSSIGRGPSIWPTS